MAIEKALDPGDFLRPPAEEGELSIEIVNPEAVSIGSEEGGMLIDFDPNRPPGEPDFTANLSEFMDDNDLEILSSDLLGMFEGDRSSRKDWEDAYTKGLDQLGLKIEERTTPWPGACGVFHPLLTEAVVRFQSQAISEIFPAGGPVRTRIVGKMDSEKEKQAERIENYMNYLTTEVMKEYRSETEKLLFSLALAGSGFRKVYFDQNLDRPVAMFVPAEDMVVSYGASSLETCERATHITKINKNDLRKFQVNGFYKDIDLQDPTQKTSDVQEKYDEITGDNPSYEADNRYTLLEMHVDVDLKGFEDTEKGQSTGIGLPYIVTIEQVSGKILSIRRNWFEDDPKKLKRQHFVHYEYLPGLGFYGFGLIHLIGGITKSATSILRQLVDAGTLSNLPGGLKARGLRIRGEDSPITPGEFRDVDVPGGAIRDSITFLPYKEPSAVLYQLLGNIVEEGRRFASITDLKIADMNNQAPVGTTLALLERSMKVMSAIQARLHASMKREFGILSQVVHDFLPDQYEYEISDQDVFRTQDFDERIDVIPVSDPNAATMSQRIMQYQAALQLAGTAPQMYDMKQLHRQMLEVLGIIPLEDEIPNRDPVAENMNMLDQKPVKVFMWQDHEAHIQTHLAAAQDPKMQELISQSPMAEAIAGSFSAHVTEHVAYQYRVEMEKELGVALPSPDEELSKDQEIQLSKLIAEAADRLLQRDQQEMAQQKAEEQAQDPILQLREKELQLRTVEAQAKVKAEQERLDLETLKSKAKNEQEAAEIESRERIAAAEIQAKLAEAAARDEREESDSVSRELIEGAKVGAEIAKELITRHKEED